MSEETEDTLRRDILAINTNLGLVTVHGTRVAETDQIADVRYIVIQKIPEGATITVGENDIGKSVIIKVASS